MAKVTGSAARGPVTKPMCRKNQIPDCHQKAPQKRSRPVTLFCLPSLAPILSSPSPHLSFSLPPAVTSALPPPPLPPPVSPSLPPLLHSPLPSLSSLTSLVPQNTSLS